MHGLELITFPWNGIETLKSITRERDQPPGYWVAAKDCQHAGWMQALPAASSASWCLATPWSFITV